jgi:hypothetical protein
LRIVARTIVMMRDPPGLPVTMRSSPLRVTIVGAIDESGRLPGAISLRTPCTSPYRFGTPGLAVKSSISSLSRKPVSPATTSAPNASLIV